MDVVTAFLKGEFQAEVYMQQPPGYEVRGKESLVCRLKQLLYRLKQSPRCWNKSFQDCIVDLGFMQCTVDPCVFIQEEAQSMTIIIVRVC